MPLVFNIIFVLVLFALLGKVADFAVNNIRYIAQALKLKMFALGVILGLVTTLPEFSVGINAAIEGAGELSVGNIMGGTVVLLGLILGITLMVNKKVDTKENFRILLPSAMVMLFPFLLGIDGRLSALDGVILVSLYAGLLIYIYRHNRDRSLDSKIAIIDKGKIGKAVIYSLLGVIGVMLISHYIVEITLDFLQHYNINKLLIGVIFFSIGTNLPEISISIMAWRKKSADLSLSHLLSSAFTHTFVLGTLSMLHPITFTIDLTYYILVFFVTLIVILFLIFARSDKKLVRTEGIILFLVYLAFLIVNLFIL